MFYLSKILNKRISINETIVEYLLESGFVLNMDLKSKFDEERYTLYSKNKIPLIHYYLSLTEIKYYPTENIRRTIFEVFSNKVTNGDLLYGTVSIKHGSKGIINNVSNKIKDIVNFFNNSKSDKYKLS